MGHDLSFRYDSLTGVPSSQRTLAFEKGSVLFNVGALYTQMGARQDRSGVQGIDKAVDAFQRAAGTDTPTVHDGLREATVTSLLFGYTTEKLHVSERIRHSLTFQLHSSFLLC